MTKLFGPCGEGWGIGEPSFQVIQGDNREILVYCTVSVWWKGDSGERNTTYGVGGDKVVSYIKANEQYNRPERWENDDEAFKKAFTDAIGNAFKHLGMSADVHMGQFDDSKYVTSMRQKFAEEAGTQQSQATAPKRQPMQTQQPPKPAPQAPSRADVDDLPNLGDWPAWIEGFKKDFLACQSLLASRELWHVHKAELAALKAAAPAIYKDLTVWARTEGDKLPKEAC